MHKTTKIIIWVVVIVIVVGGVILMNRPSSDEPIKIGFIGPLTGNLAYVGEDSRNALSLKMEEINRNGGVHSRPVQIIFEDSEGSAAKAVSVFNKLTDVDHVRIVVGGDSTPATLAVLSIAENKGVTYVSYFSPSQIINEGGEAIVKIRPDLENQSEIMSSYLLDRGITRVAIMFDRGNDAVLPAKEAFIEFFTGAGGEIIASESFTAADTDFRTQLAKINQVDPQAVWVASIGKSGGLIVKQAQELRFSDSVVFAGLSNWVARDFIDAGGEAAEHAIFTSEPFDCNVEAFKAYCEQYRTQYPDANPFYAGGYATDALELVVTVLRGIPKEQLETFGVDDFAQRVRELTEFPGLMNKYDLSQNGKVHKGNYIIKTVRDGQFVLAE